MQICHLRGQIYYVVGIVSQRRALKGQVARGACTDGDLVIRVGHVNLPEQDSLAWWRK